MISFIADAAFEASMSCSLRDLGCSCWWSSRVW